MDRSSEFRNAQPARLRPAHTVTMALILLCALLAASPLWGPGIVNTRGGGDSPFLLQRTVAMAESLRAGDFPPRWMAHAAYDLGYPFFNHYAALPYYLSGALTALGVNVLSAIQITQTLGFLLAACTMNLWAGRVFRSRAARLLAVVAYTFAPFHLVNVYVRGDSLSEFYAFIWYPLILWALDRVVERPTRGRVIGAALAYGALILTHNVSVVIFSPFALLYGASAIWRQRIAKDHHESVNGPSPDAILPARSGNVIPTLVRIVAVFVIGMLLTAWFWLPALTETEYGQMGAAFTEDYFHYSSHFRGRNLVQASPLFNYSVAATTEQAGPFAMGLVQAVLALLGALSLGIRTARWPRGIDDQSGSIIHNGTLLISLGLATWMMTPLSRPLWDHLPLLELTQFPWRFLSVQAVFTAILTGAIMESLASLLPSPASLWGRIALTLLIAGVVIGSALGSLRPDRLLIRAEDVTHENLLLYESFTGNIGTTIRHEYLPRDVVPRPYISEAVVDGGAGPIAEGYGPLQANLIEQSPTRQSWRVTVPAEGSIPVSFPLNAWPGWQAKIDDVPAAGYAMTGSGRLTVDVPPGEHTVTLRLRSTPLQLGAAALSIVAALACGGWLIHGRRRMPAFRRLTMVAGWGLGGLVLASIGPLLLQRPPAAAATFFDFHQMPFPHQGPVDFGPVKLVSARTANDTGAPGQRLDVVLGWEPASADGPTTARSPDPVSSERGLESGPSPITVTVRLVSPAEPRHGVDYVLTGSTVPLAPETRVTLDLPDDLARGLYLLQVRAYDETGELTARTPQGRTMGTLYIGAVRVPKGPTATAAPPLATFRDLTLHGIQTAQTDPDKLHLTLDWSTSGTPRNWYLSLRLLDLDGNQITQQDHQPGYWYLPTTLWHPGEQVTDHATLSLPEGLAPGEYVLRVITYLQATMEGGGEVDIPVHLSVPTYYDLRSTCCEVTRKGTTILCQTNQVALLELDRPAAIAEGDDLELHPVWNALLQPATDLEATWTLATPEGDVVNTWSGPLAPGSRTARWPRHTWVRSHVALDLPDRLPAGDYHLALRLEDGETTSVTCDQVATVTVNARPRSFTLPPVPHAQTATFGTSDIGGLNLLGYDLYEDRRADRLSLTLWWQALEAPQTDLKRFVHLYDPETEQVPAQNDAMPRDWTYPTSWWAAGEVVSETLHLDLTDVPAGTYHLGIGWYDPETLERVPVTSPEASSQETRVTLDTPIRRR